MQPCSVVLLLSLGWVLLRPLHYIFYLIMLSSFGTNWRDSLCFMSLNTHKFVLTIKTYTCIFINICLSTTKYIYVCVKRVSWGFIITSIGDKRSTSTPYKHQEPSQTGKPLSKLRVTLDPITHKLDLIDSPSSVLCLGWYWFLWKASTRSSF